MSSWTVTKYKTRNWADYNRSLKECGFLYHGNLLIEQIAKCLATIKMRIQRQSGCERSFGAK
jgi:hypothetical protein